MTCLKTGDFPNLFHLTTVCILNLVSWQLKETEICLDCFMLKERFKKETDEITERWIKRKEDMVEHREEENAVKGSAGVGVDFIIIRAAAQAPRHGAARALRAAEMLNYSPSLAKDGPVGTCPHAFVGLR